MSTRAAAYDDLLKLPENMVGEIIEGVLHTQPRPAGPAAFVASGLAMDVGGPFDRGRGGPGGWYLTVEPELHLGANVLVPDIAAWRIERLPAHLRKEAAFSVAPDWIAEIASPATTQRDRLLKVPLYAAAAVDFLWLIEPLEGRVEAYERAGTRWVWLGTWADETQARIPPFDAVAMDLVRLWTSTGLRG